MRNRANTTLGKQTFERDLARIRAGILRQPPSTTIDHGGLSGLTDDDHANYVHLSNARTITVAHTFNPPLAGVPFNIGANASGQLVTGLNSDLWDGNQFADIFAYSATNLTLQPSGDIYLDPGGDDVLPSTPYTVNLGQITNKFLTLHAAELVVETLVAQDTIATIGGRILVGPTTKLTSDLTSIATSIEVEHNNITSDASAGGGKGDILYLEAGGNVEFMRAVTGPSGAGPYTYGVSGARNLDGSGANSWSAGDAVFIMGTTTDGWLDLFSSAGVLGTGTGPAIVGNVKTGTAYNSYQEHFAIGNLNGQYGVATNLYGVGLGEYSSEHILLDGSNGLQFRNSTTVMGKLSATSWTLGQDTGDNVYITTSGIQVRESTTVRFDAHTNYLKIGRSTASAAYTAMVVVNASSLSYNGETLYQNDILIGDSSTGKGNIWWDHSDGSIHFRNGQNDNISVASDGRMHFTASGDSGTNYLYFTNTAVTTFADLEGFLTLNKTDTNGNVYGIMTLGARHDTDDAAMIGFEWRRIAFAIEQAGTWDYPLDLQSNIVHISDSVLEMVERTSTANPTAADARLFTKDNGSGKTQLCVIFATGSAIVLATEV